MTKTISKIGNSQGIIFDAVLMDLARVKVGDQVTVTAHEGGCIVLTPIRPVIDPKKAGAAARGIDQKEFGALQAFVLSDAILDATTRRLRKLVKPFRKR